MLPIRLVFAVALQNLVHPFLLEDHCGVLLLFGYLAEFGQMFGFQNLFLPTFSRLKNFFLFSFFSKTHRMRRAPGIRLLTSFSQHTEHCLSRCPRALSSHIDGATPDLLLKLDGV